MSEGVKCWCGEHELRDFSAAFLRCDLCQTLVHRRAAAMGDGCDGTASRHRHQARETEPVTPIERRRLDLIEEGPFWLRTILKYKLPPARVLAVGDGTNCMLPLLSSAGYAVTQLEPTPGLPESSARALAVAVEPRDLATEQIAAGSFDVVAMRGALEQLPDPAATLPHYFALLPADGLIVAQTPCYEEGVSHDELVAARSPFLQLLSVPEHLHLFSKSSVSALFSGVGAESMVFEQAMATPHDMYFAASRQPLAAQDRQAIDAALDETAGGRTVRALLDALDQVRLLEVVAGERLEVLVRANRELVAALAERAMFESAASERLALLAGAERRIGEMAQLERRCLEIESAAETRLAELQSVASQRAALAEEVELLRRAVQVRDRRVLDLERELDRRGADSALVSDNKTQAPPRSHPPRIDTADDGAGILGMLRRRRNPGR